MHRKALVCRRDVFFRLKILSFGKKCDEVVQMKIRGIRKAIFCETLTYSERAESQLSPKVSLTTICDLHLLLRVLDRWECFPSLRRSRLQFFCYFNIGTTEVEDSSSMLLLVESSEIVHDNMPVGEVYLSSCMAVLCRRKLPNHWTYAYPAVHD